MTEPLRTTPQAGDLVEFQSVPPATYQVLKGFVWPNHVLLEHVWSLQEWVVSKDDFYTHFRPLPTPSE